MKGSKMKVYIKNNIKYPKRIDDKILAYYANGNVIIMRNKAKRELLAQNIKIRNNQAYVCELWSNVSLRIKKIFALYAKAYKHKYSNKRAQGVSSFSIFLKLLYKIKDKYHVEIQEISFSLLCDVLLCYNSLAKLIKNGFLDRVISKIGHKMMIIVKSFYYEDLCCTSLRVRYFSSKRLGIFTP